MRNIILVLVAFRKVLWLFVSAQSTVGKDRKTIVLMVDGLSNWVLNTELNNDNTNTLGFQQLIQNGVKAQYLLPEFPSKSLPNYYSLATGRFVRKHGIIGNYMYDRDRREYFSNLEYHSDQNLYWWNSSVPIWVTASHQKLKIAMYWWPGCNVQFGGLNLTSLCPKSFQDPSEASDFISQIPVILQQISHENLRLIFINYGALKVASRQHGPASGMAKTKLEQISNVLFTLQHAIEAYGMFDSVNLVVVSSHGMSPITLESNLYFLDDYLDSLHLLDVVLDNGSWMLLYPKLGKDYEVYQQLSKVPHTRIFWKDQLLSRWELKETKHLPPMLLLCDAGYGIYCRNCGDKQFPKVSGRVRDNLSKGLSGYDNAAEKMHAVFLARGPDFKVNHRHRWLRMVDLYPIFCYSIGIECGEHDGSWERVADMLNLAANTKPFSLLVPCTILFVAYVVERIRI